MPRHGEIGHRYTWGHSRPFNDLSSYLTTRFGHRVQKLSIDAGFTCPNRDGTKGTGGCTFCDNTAFSPPYCSPALSVTNQLDRGIAFFRNKYPSQSYLAYFQSYTNTYAPLQELIRLYGEALAHPKVVGLVVGTRPDCISGELLEYLTGLAGSTYLAVEYGIETTNNNTLARINRGHTWEESKDAVFKSAGRGFLIGAHFIVGLPGESAEEMVDRASEINRLPLDMVKLHHLQIISGTGMEIDFNRHPEDYRQFTADEYIDMIIKFLERLRPEIVVERFVNVSPPGMIRSLRWGLKNHEFVARMEREMNNRATWQGRLFMRD
jgi:hypothetical protein